MAGMSMDSDRIESHIEAEGGEVERKSWRPFGIGWFGNQSSDRIYKVTYRDKDKNRHEAYVKTSLFSGVYFSKDKVVERNKDAEKYSKELKRENEELKKEVARLKKRNRWF